MFCLAPDVLKQYRKLKLKPDARREFSIIPFGAFVWEDEHPGGECAMPDLDQQSEISIIQMVAARTALWLSGEVPSELQQLWGEARNVLPDWPGFARLTISEREKLEIRAMQEKMDAFEELLRADADEFTRTEGAPGVLRITARFRPQEPNENHDKDDDP